MSATDFPLRVSTLLLFICLLTMVNSTSALAGPHEGGVLFVHTDDSVVFTDGDDFSGASSLGCECGDFGKCPLGDPTSDRSSEPFVWWVLAAFPDGCPQLQGISFGVEHPGLDTLDFLAWGPGSGFEVADIAWPETGTGTVVAWQEPIRTPIVEVYWFAAQAYYGAGTFELTGHPREGGLFADDTIPPVIDSIVGYGSLGFAGAVGTSPFGGTRTVEMSWGLLKQEFGLGSLHSSTSRR